MPAFSYKAKDKEENLTEGVEIAENRFDLAESLKSRGFTVLSVSLTKEPSIDKLRKFISDFLSRIGLEEKINFARNVGVMIGSGISLSRALEIEFRQSSNEKLKPVLSDLINTVKKGGSFSAALGSHPRIFPGFFKEMVFAGEKSGKLEESLKLVVLQLSRDYALRKKVKSAMVYPAIVFLSMIAIAILMMIFVVPSLVATFNELNIDLPASTSFIIFVSGLIQQKGVLFATILALISYAVFYSTKTGFGKKVLDYSFAYAPLVGGINRKFNAARVCRSLSSLISSGVPIVESFNITKDLIENHLYKKILEKASISIKRGESISKSFLSDKSLFPPLVGEMISVGEETGKVSSMLSELAKFYESEVNSATKDLSTVVEPILMIIIGIVVGFFAISMISPMYNLAGGF